MIIALQASAQSLPPVVSATNRETPVFAIPAASDAGIWLDMGYARHEIRNREAAKRYAQRQVLAVTVVFTRYPADSLAWLTSYDALLLNRRKALFALLPQAFEPAVKWTYLRQTDCPSAAAAQQLPHGIWVSFSPENPAIAPSSLPLPAVSAAIIPTPNDAVEPPDDFRPATRQLTDIVYGAILYDSTAWKVIQRNANRWRDMLVVVDWTGSMYQYGASVLLWQRLNIARNEVRHFIFFNDGNNARNDEKTIGKTGGIYHIAGTNIDSVMRLMDYVMRRGTGGDLPENDVEAILRGVRGFSDYQDVVLIADNLSAVRDIKLAPLIGKPVHIVLCGTPSSDYPIHADFLRLARDTGGSLHTIAEDIENLTGYTEGQEIKIGKFTYRVQNGNLVSVRKE